MRLLNIYKCLKDELRNLLNLSYFLAKVGIVSSDSNLKKTGIVYVNNSKNES